MIKNYEIIRALVNVRTQITALDRALNAAIIELMPDDEELPPVNVLAPSNAALDLGDNLPPQCATGVCNDD